MADLSITYSKTPKGLRARSSLIGGLSGKLFKVLSLIDGVSKAQTILTKHDDISADKLLIAIAKLESEGYIKPAVASVFNDDDDWDFGTISDIVVRDGLQVEEPPIEQKQADEALAALELARQAKQAEQAKQAALAKQAADAKAAETKAAEATKLAETKPAETAKSAETKSAEKAQQQQALIKAIEIAKAQTKLQEKIDVENAAAAQKKIKLEALTKLKVAQLKAKHAEQVAQNLANVKAEEQRIAAETAAKQAQDSLALQMALEKTAKAKLAVEADRARKEKLRLAAAAEAKKTEKETQLVQKIAFAEAEQLRLMAEFEENAKRDAATAQLAQRAALVAAAKQTLKAKAEARAKAQQDALALKNATKNG